MSVMHFNKLTTNLEAMLHESMVKIGYIKGQAVGIYYAESLLHHLLDLPSGNVEEAMELLKQFADENEEAWGWIVCSYNVGRYQLIVPAKGMEYVYEKNKDNHFLEELIQTLRQPDVTIDQVLKVFHQYSDDIICDKANHDEFEYAVQFNDKTIDQFIYCFTFDEMGQYYHRFTEYDFLNLN